MGTSAARYKILLLILLLFPQDLWAEAEDFAFTGRYRFTWGGILLGTLVLSMQETPSTYTMRLKVDSRGVVNLFTKHSNDTVANGDKREGAYNPRFYESYYKTKHKPRHIRWVQDSEGNVTEEINEPPENRAIRPEVPPELKKGALDPLTLTLAIRAGAGRIRAFDVKRLYDISSVPKTPVTLSVLGREQRAQPYVLTRAPVAGLTEKEKKKYNEEGEPPMTLYFSLDEKRVPLLVTVPVALGIVRGTLVRECATWDECVKD